MGIQVDELRLFLGQPPPRHVPAFIRKEALKRVPLVLLVFGIVFGGFGMPFLLLFFPWRIVDEVRLNMSPRVTQEAVVDSREETAMEENDRDVFKYAFTYTPADGITRTGICYKTGDDLSAGSRVTVEYLAGTPSVARIKDCRLSPFGWAAGFVVIFPLVGFGMAYFTLQARWRLFRLLRYGRFSSGRVEAVESTNMRVNNRLRYRVTVSYTDDFTERKTSYSAYGEDVILAENRRENGATVGLLYDPSHPDRVFLVDELLARAP